MMVYRIDADAALDLLTWRKADRVRHRATISVCSPKFRQLWK